MPVPMICPRCRADFREEEIPPADQPSYGGETHFSRVIGIYSHEADATVAWQCPDCGHEWPQTGELSFGFRTFNLISRFPVGPGPAAGEQPAEGVAQEPASTGQPPRRKRWQFWK